MPNIGTLLKDEIRRLAKKEGRALLATVRKDNIRLKRDMADLKRRLAGVERDNRRLVDEADARLKQAAQASPEEVANARVGASQVRALRKRLKLTQAEFGTLIGVAGNTVLVLEKKQGRLNLRESTKAAIVAARKLGAREARRKVDLLAPTSVDAGARKKTR